MSAAATPLATSSRKREQKKDVHTISLFVKNEPGVLVRVAMVFSRRGYNIESLVVSPAARDGFSRMTITSSGDPAILEQMIKQLAKLVDVVRAIDHTHDDAYETEIALLKLRCSPEERSEILQIAEHFNAKVVDYGRNSVVLRVYGSSEKLDAMTALLRGFDVAELVRTGKILMARGIGAT
ncbi:MAG: acetolactate synthase small subunit [Deltaproteobacteria bacterium]|nr:acetolactate synthase small subunit [Deltaproteobacteria bacterium]MBW2386177.1 acetolactate synthase small subunit [Deltaproteobacteria bacterium]